MFSLRISEAATDMFKYNLIGIVVHSGGVNSGHYFSYSKRGDEVKMIFEILNDFLL